MNEQIFPISEAFKWLFGPLYGPYTFVLAKLSVQKRKQSLCEVRRSIGVILSVHGSDDAFDRVKTCFGKCEHYRITLGEAGFDGTWEMLLEEASRSVLRASDRKRDTLRGFGFVQP